MVCQQSSLFSVLMESTNLKYKVCVEPDVLPCRAVVSKDKIGAVLGARYSFVGLERNFHVFEFSREVICISSKM